MSAPRLLIDNDILAILSCSSLLDDAIQALGSERSSAFHLGTLPYVMDGDNSLRQLSNEQKRMIRATCNELPVIVDQPSITTQQTLANVRNIHAGEAVLYGLAADHSTYLITTGDKEAMRALVSAPELKEIRQLLAGRIVCLETLCLELIRVRGVYQVAEAFNSSMPRHKSLRTYFGTIEYSGEKGCHDAIQHYLQLLERDLGSGLLWSR